jgi:hypothetical protein
MKTMKRTRTKSNGLFDSWFDAGCIGLGWSGLVNTSPENTATNA